MTSKAITGGFDCSICFFFGIDFKEIELLEIVRVFFGKGIGAEITFSPTLITFTG